MGSCFLVRVLRRTKENMGGVDEVGNRIMPVFASVLRLLFCL
jgi:hypothetical protein